MSTRRCRCNMFYLLFICCFFIYCDISLAADTIEGYVFIRDNNIWVKTTDDNEKKLLDDEVNGISVSDNGKLIYSVVEDPNIGSVSLNYLSIGESKPKKVDIIPTSNYSISKNGLYFAYTKEIKHNPSGHIFNVNNNTKLLIPFEPFPKTIRKSLGNWNWYADGPYYWSNDGNVLAFARCSGDQETPSCVVYYKNINSNSKPLLIGEELIKKQKLIPKHTVIGVSEGNIYFDDMERLYSYTISTKTIDPIADDAQCSSISPDGKFISYMSTFRTKGGANLYIADISGKTKKALTNYKKLDIENCSTSWSSNGKQIYVTLSFSAPNNNLVYPAWRIDRDGSNLTRLVGINEAVIGLWKTTIPISFMQK